VQLFLRKRLLIIARLFCKVNKQTFFVFLLAAVNKWPVVCCWHGLLLVLQFHCNFIHYWTEYHLSRV